MEIHVFPGQGSQQRGMGAELFDTVPEFSEWEREIDLQLGYSLRDMCTRDPDGLLGQTEYTQPCLYVVNALYHLDRIRKTGRFPDAVAGHSLGEYDALWVSGAIDFFSGLQLVKKRGELMGQVRGGGMAAIIGLSILQIEDVLDRNDLHSLEITSRNSPQQNVLSGPVVDLERAVPLMEQAGARLCSMLQVSAAFHSVYMRDAQALFASFLEKFTFRPLRCTVVSNVTGQPYPMSGWGNVVRSLLAQQMTRPVLWTDSITYLLQQGAGEFTEMGPGKVLTRLVDQIRRATPAETARRAPDPGSPS